MSLGLLEQIKAALWNLLGMLPGMRHVVVRGTTLSKMNSHLMFKRMLISLSSVTVRGHFALFVVKDTFCLFLDLRGVCVGV